MLLDFNHYIIFQQYTNCLIIIIEAIYMKKFFSIHLLLLAAVLPTLVAATDQAIEDCIQTIMNEKEGEFVKLEALDVKGKTVYEFEIRDENGFEYEFMCDTKGKIFERETESASADSRAFKKHAKITEEDAIKTALESYPGKVEELEYEIEADGAPSYEIDIVGKNGVETKVEVDAVTGKIIEVSTEKWEIGIEDDARL